MVVDRSCGNVANGSILLETRSDAPAEYVQTHELLDGNASIDPNADTLHAGEAFGGTHTWLGIDVGGKVLQGLGSCLFPDLAVHMATGPAAQFSSVQRSVP